MADSDYEVRLKTTGRNDRAMAKPKAAKDAEGEADTKGSDKRTRSTKHQQKQSGFGGRASDGKPKNIPRRGAV